MKLPTEGELIELENWVFCKQQHPWAPYCSIISTQDAYERIRVLIAIARDPSELLRSIPDDDFAAARAIDGRTMRSEPSTDSHRSTPKGVR